MKMVDVLFIASLAKDVHHVTMAAGRYVQPRLLKYIHQSIRAPAVFGQMQSQAQNSYLSTDIIDWYVKN